MIIQPNNFVICDCLRPECYYCGDGLRMSLNRDKEITDKGEVIKDV